jgi:hypothetical protein
MTFMEGELSQAPTHGKRGGEDMLLSWSRIVNSIEHDLACGIALGFFEHRRARVTLEAITLYDKSFRVRDLRPNWLGEDPLDQATREYLEAGRALTRSSGTGANGKWSSSAIQAREEILARALAAKARARDILQERDTWSRAREAGMAVLEPLSSFFTDHA